MQSNQNVWRNREIADDRGCCSGLHAWMTLALRIISSASYSLVPYHWPSSPSYIRTKYTYMSHLLPLKSLVSRQRSPQPNHLLEKITPLHLLFDAKQCESEHSKKQQGEAAWNASYVNQPFAAKSDIQFPTVIYLYIHCGGERGQIHTVNTTPSNIFLEWSAIRYLLDAVLLELAPVFASRVWRWWWMRKGGVGGEMRWDRAWRVG